METGLIKTRLAIPEIPKEWDYEISVKKCRNLFKEVREKGAEALTEFFRAYLILTEDSKKKKNRKYPDKTFIGYCEDVRIDIKTGYNWLHKYFKVPKRRILEISNIPLILPANIHLLEGDFFNKIHDVSDQSIDLFITDPPYGVMEDYDWDKFPNYEEFLKSVFGLVFKKLKKKHTGFIFADARMMYRVHSIISQYSEIKNTLVWIRKNLAQGRVIKDKFISSYEAIFYFGTRELNIPSSWGEERFDSFEYAVPQSSFEDRKYHPTQKPIELFARLIKIGSFEGDTILDCFAGSGTAGVVAEELGRDCYLIEKEPKYIEIIKGRIGGLL